MEMGRKISKRNCALLTLLIITLIFPLTISQSSKNRQSSNQPLTIERIYSGCNVIKGCFSSPPGCVMGQNCDYLVTYHQLEDTNFQFQLLGAMNSKRGGYVALGLSKDHEMGSDSVFGCYVAQNGHVHVHEYVNSPRIKNNVEVIRENGKDVFDPSSRHGVAINGLILCEFRVKSLVDLRKELNLTFDLSNSQLYLFLAKGPTQNTDQLGYHVSKISSNPIYLAEYGNAPLSQNNFYRKTDHRYFGLPSGCVKREDCEVIVAFKEDIYGSFKFELMGRHDWVDPRFGYVAVGFSTDEKMGEDSVIGCFLTGQSEVRVKEFYNLKISAGRKTNAKVDRRPENRVVDGSGSFQDGFILCHMTLHPIIDLTGYINKIFNLTEDRVHILVARGDNASDDNLGCHQPNHRRPSLQSYLLSDQTPIDEDHEEELTTPPSTPSIPSTKFEDQYKDCGVTKGCFGFPGSCMESRDCKILVNYHQVENGFEFEMLGELKTGAGYVAVGISSDKNMGGDSVIGCYVQGSDVHIGEFYNTEGKQSSNAPVRRGGGEDIILRKADSIQDGHIFCRFVLKSQIDLTTYLNKIFNLNLDKIHLLVASGDKASAEKLEYHLKMKASTLPVDLRQTQSVTSKPAAKEEFLPKEQLTQERIDGMYEGCGNHTGCFGLPPKCIQTKNCHVFVSWSNNSREGFDLELMSQHANSEGYVAMGLSTDDSMSSDSVFGCYLSGDSVAVGEFFNIKETRGNSRVERNESTVTPIRGSFHDGLLTCKFSIVSNIDLTHHMGNVFKLQEYKYHILLSRGDNVPGSLGKHPQQTDRGSSPHPVSLLDNVSISGVKSPILIELHGALMILAWILLASVGMFTARYFKQTFTHCAPKQKAIWFWIHQCCMVTAVLLTLLAIILIFLEVEGYTWENSSYQSETYHPILGIILVCLSLLQIFIALFRPDPQSSKRIFFNWIHWIIATMAHGIALATIFLSCDLQKSNLSKDTTYKYTIAVFVILHLTLHLLMSVHTYTIDMMREITHKFRAFLPGPLRPSGSNDEYQGTGFRTTLLFVEVAGAFIITTILINCICSNL